jgi:hypothetical protein
MRSEKPRTAVSLTQPGRVAVVNSLLTPQGRSGPRPGGCSTPSRPGGSSGANLSWRHNRRQDNCRRYATTMYPVDRCTRIHSARSQNVRRVADADRKGWPILEKIPDADHREAQQDGHDLGGAFALSVQRRSKSSLVTIVKPEVDEFLKRSTPLRSERRSGQSSMRDFRDRPHAGQSIAET